MNGRETCSERALIFEFAQPNASRLSVFASHSTDSTSELPGTTVCSATVDDDEDDEDDSGAESDTALLPPPPLPAVAPAVRVFERFVSTSEPVKPSPLLDAVEQNKNTSSHRCWRTVRARTLQLGVSDDGATQR